MRETLHVAPWITSGSYTSRRSGARQVQAPVGGSGAELLGERVRLLRLAGAAASIRERDHGLDLGARLVLLALLDQRLHQLEPRRRMVRCHRDRAAKQA